MHFLLVLCLLLLGLFNLIVAERALLVDHVLQIPCKGQINYPQLLTGEQVFKAARVPAITVQDLMITMWVFPQGYTSKTHTVFSIYDLTPSPIQVVSLQYNFNTATFNMVFKGMSSSNLHFDNGQWHFVRILVSLSPISSGFDSLEIHISSDTTPVVSTSMFQPASIGIPLTFNRTTLLFNLGYSSSLISDIAACSLIRQVGIEFNFAISEWGSISKFFNKETFPAKLLIHYDFKYSDVNTSKLLSHQSYLNRLYDISLNPVGSGEFEFAGLSQLDLGFFSLSEENGLIICFEAKTFASGLNFDILTLKLNGLSEVKLQYDTLNQVLFNYSPSFTVANAWYQYVIQISWRTLSTMQITFSVNHIYQKRDISFPIFSNVSIQFGDKLVSALLRLHNIRIYTGSRVIETPTCWIQVQGESDDCLICQNTYLLSYQDNKICVPPGPPVIRQTVVDWVRGNCPYDMMHSTFDSTCECPFQTYYDGTACIKCPSYCRGCKSSTDCIENDLSRDLQTGKCPTNLFDDGYNCVLKTFWIYQRTNLEASIAGLSAFSTAFTSSMMNIDPIAFSFSFAFEVKISQVVPLTLTTIARFDEAGTPKFEITIDQDALSEGLIIKFNYGTLMSQSFEFPVMKQNSIWISVFIKMSFLVIVVDSYRNTQYIHQLTSILSTLYYPTLTIGDVNNSYLYNPLQYSNYLNYYPLQFDEVKFISEIEPPANFINDFIHLGTNKSILLQHFQLTNKASGLTTTFNNVSSNPNFLSSQLVMNINTPIHRMKGLRMNGSMNGSINNFNVKKEMAITFTVLISRFESNKNFIQYNMQGVNVGSSFVQQRSREESGIRVRIGLDFVETKSCTVKASKPTFIAFIQRFQYYNDNEVMSSVEVVIDFCRETLTMWNLSAKKLLIENFQLLSEPTIDLFLNNLKIISGREFYFDYTDSDPCFMYYDLANMKCLKTKSEYAMHGNSFLLANDCEQIASESIYLYNQYSEECIDTQVIKACKIIDEETFTCIECKDINADPLNLCVCKVGYFYNEDIQRCDKCYEKCSTCDSNLNCTSCKSELSFLSTCECNEPNQFFLFDSGCQNCDSKCSGCDYFADECLQCAENRINPPYCNCNPLYFDPITSTPTTCVPYACSSKCEICDLNNNCVTCAANRSDPPTCNCNIGLSEWNDGTCQECPSHFFYDKQINQCLECDPRCLECSGSSLSCIQCKEPLIVHNEQCVCTDFSPFKELESGDIICLSTMDVSLHIRTVSGILYLVFTFNQEIDEIDSSEIEIDHILFIYFDSIPQFAYKMKSAELIDNKEFVVEMEFQDSHLAQQGSVLFLDTALFYSTIFGKYLDPKYTQIPLHFNVNSFVLKSGSFIPSEMAETVIKYLENLSKNSLIFVLFRDLQVAFYVVNTLQPSVVYLLINTRTPPNLQMALKMIGLLIFPAVYEPNEVQDSKNNRFAFFGEQLKLNKDILPNSNGFFSRFGLSNSLFVSMPISFIQFIFFTSASFILYLIITCSNKVSPSFLKAKVQIWNRINACFEGGILIFIVLSTNQFDNIEAEQFFNRVSIYISCFTLLTIIGINGRNFLAIHKNRTEDQIELSKKLKPINKSILYMKAQTCKKMIISVLVVLLSDLPRLLCFILGSILLISMVVTVVMRPYCKPLQNIIKVLGEACQLFIWIIFAFVIIPLQSNFSENERISEEQTSNFLKAGQFCIYALILFNIIYVIEFGFSIIWMISEIQKNRRNQQKKRKYKTFHGELFL